MFWSHVQRRNMTRSFLWLVLLAVIPGISLQAAERAGQQRSISRTYVSPGASGSVGESSRQQGYSGYGGYQVPDSRYENRTYQGTGSTQTRGTIKQSTEYPGVGEFERQPGSRSVERNRR